MNTPSPALASLTVRGDGGKDFEILLTADHVSADADDGIFGRQRVTLPLDAVTEISNGWRRSRLALVLGALVLFSGLLMAANGDGVGGMVFGGLWLAAAWFLKLRGFRVASASAAISGKPRDEAATEAFVEAIVAARSR